MKWTDIPKVYKAVIVVVPIALTGFTYHEQFITEAEASEQQSRAQAQLIMLRVDNKEAEKRALIREKTQAVEDGKPAKAEQLEQDIQTLRDQIKGLCDQIEEC